MTVIKTKSLFDHLKDLHTKETTWDNLTESDRKTFSVYMVNRFLSMNPDYIDIINELQPVITSVEPRFAYIIYQTILPKSRGFFSKYIKATSSRNYTRELINLISSQTDTATYEVIDFLDILPDINRLHDFVKSFGKSEKEIEKILKTKNEE